MPQKRSTAARIDGAVNGSPARKAAAHAHWSELTAAQRQVVATIRRSGSCTREQLGTQLVWSPSAVSKVVSPMLAGDILESMPPGVRRRKAQLSSSAELGFSIGI